jgi:pilus assembly protein Flp/PilA
MKNLFVRFVREDAGQDLIEYALIAGLVSIVAVAAITSTGGSIKSLWESVDTAVSGAVTP